MTNESTAAIRDIIADLRDKLTITEARARHAESEVERLEAEKAELVDALRESDVALNAVWECRKIDSEVWGRVQAAMLTNTNILAKYEPPA